MDMLLTADDDITLTEGGQDLQLVTGQAAIGQHIKMRIRTWLGETAYDITAGLPYLQVIFAGGAGETERTAVRLIVQKVVEDTPGVTGATVDPPEIDPLTRVLTVSGRATTIAGDVDFSETIGA